MVYWIESLENVQLGIMAHPPGDDALQFFVYDLVDQGVDCVVSALTADEEEVLGLNSEKKIFASSGIGFISFPIEDRGIPNSMEETRKLISQIRNRLLAGETFLIHCRLGIGRSSLLAACILSQMGFTSEMAFSVIGEARGRTVPDTEAQKNFVESFGVTSP